MTRIVVQSDGQEFDCAEDDTILRAALRSGIGMPYSCNVGSCGNCRFELIDGEVEHLRSDAPAWTERDLKRNRWLGCQARPKSGCTIKFRAAAGYVSKHRPARRQAELLSARPLTHDITEFSFRIEGAQGFLPGQYALFTTDEIHGGRAYSMSNTAGDGTWQFQIKRMPQGAMTGFLFEQARPGTRLTLDGPYGTAYLRSDSPRDIVLMAGGSGLSPMVSIARGAQAAGMLPGRKLHFFYGCRGEQDLFDRNSLGEAMSAVTSFTPALSGPDVATGWSGSTGFLHDVVRETLGAALKDHEVYFAGPAVMSSAVQKMAFDAGVPMEQLHFDEFY